MRKRFWKIPVASLWVSSILWIAGPKSTIAEAGLGAADPDTVVTKDQDEPESARLKLEPYVVLWSAAAYETARTNSGDYTFFVLSPSAEGDAAFHLDAKSSRFGVRLLGPDICFLGCGTARGMVELDFQGSFVTENKPGPLLRHAYWEIEGASFRILGGQTWDVVSPLNPGTLMYTVGWSAGNIGYRRAQLRGEKWFAVNRNTSIILQVSANADIVSDFSADPSIAGDHASWPVLEGRIGVSQPGAGIGFSGHVGEQMFDFPPASPGFDTALQTWSANLDAVVRISHRVTLRGEFFTGSNLGAYLGGVLQGVDFTRRAGIASRGGWAELSADMSSSVSGRIGFGIDDPDDHDLSDASQRTRNAMVFGNVTYSIVSNYVFGIEVSYWETKFVGLEKGDALHVAMVTKFIF